MRAGRKDTLDAKPIFLHKLLQAPLFLVHFTLSVCLALSVSTLSLADPFLNTNAPAEATQPPSVLSGNR